MTLSRVKCVLVAAGGVDADAAVAGALGVQQRHIRQLALVDVEAGLLPRLAVRDCGVPRGVAGAGVVGEGVLAQRLAILPASSSVCHRSVVASKDQQAMGHEEGQRGRASVRSEVSSKQPFCHDKQRRQPDCKDSVGT